VAKRAAKLTRKQLDKLLEEAAAAWASVPGTPTRLRDVVLATTGSRCPDVAVAHALVHVLGELGLGRRAVFSLMIAAEPDWRSARLKNVLPGPAWKRMYEDAAVQMNLASSMREGQPTEAENGKD
jgi:hypothetical protein